MKYITGIPRTGKRHAAVIAGDLRLVHACRPEYMREVGPESVPTRMWVQDSHDATPLEPCDCRWAPSIPRHYCVDADAVREQAAA